MSDEIQMNDKLKQSPIEPDSIGELVKEESQYRDITVITQPKQVQENNGSQIGKGENSNKKEEEILGNAQEPPTTQQQKNNQSELNGEKTESNGHQQQVQKIKSTSQRESQRRESDAVQLDQYNNFYFNEVNSITDKNQHNQFIRLHNFSPQSMQNNQRSPSKPLFLLTNEKTDEIANQNIKELNILQKQRQLCDQNAELLANRLALMAQQEMMAKKQIQEVRKQALQIYYRQLQKQKQQQQQEKEAQQAERELQQKKMEAEKKFQEALKQKEDHQLQQQQLQMQRKKQAQEIKEESKKIAEIIQRKKDITIEHNQMKQVNVSYQVQQGRHRVYDYFNRQKDHYQSQVQVSQQVEKLRLEQKFEQIKKMQDYEAELIERLKNTQQVQFEACQQLLNAKQLNPQDFSQRYLSVYNDSNSEIHKQSEYDQNQQTNLSNNEELTQMLQIQSSKNEISKLETTI